MATAAGPGMAPPSPTPLAPSGVKGEGCSSRSTSIIGHVGGRGLQVVEEGGREELPLRVVAEFLEQRGADAVHRRAVHHALDDERIELAAAVVHDEVLEDGDRAGARMHLDQAAVRRVGEDELGAHAPLGVDGRGERILVRVAGLEPGLFARRQAQHVGVGGARELGEGDPPVRRAPHHDGAVAQLEVGRVDLQPMRGQPAELVRHARGLRPRSRRRR